MFERRRQLALPDFCPGGVCGAAADGADRAQRRRSEFCELAIGQRFDFSDAFKNRLKECRFVLGPGLEPRRKLGIVDREAFAGSQKRIIAQSSWVSPAFKPAESSARRSRGKNCSMTLPPVFEAPPASHVEPIRWL